MNCCDYDCNQGRDCPARKCRHCYGTGYDASGHPCTCKPAKVAKVGRKDHGKAALPRSLAGAYLKDLARAMLLILAVMLVSAAVVAILK